MVLRHMEPLSAGDLARLRAFAAAHPGLQWWLQPGGLETVKLLDDAAQQLSYGLPEFGITMFPEVRRRACSAQSATSRRH